MMEQQELKCRVCSKVVGSTSSLKMTSLVCGLVEDKESCAYKEYSACSEEERQKREVVEKEQEEVLLSILKKRGFVQQEEKKEEMEKE